MQSSGVSAWRTTRSVSWFDTIYRRFRTYITLPTGIGLFGGALVLLLLLVPPEPWNFRLPLYLVVFVWTLLQPRIALYLLPIAVPWGSLDYIDAGGLRLNSADLLVVFLVTGWLLSFTLPWVKFRGARAVNTTGPAGRETANIPTYLVFAMLALLGVMLLSMTVAISISSSLKEMSKWLELAVVVLVGAQYLCTRRQIWIVVVFILLAGISQSIFGYVQAFLNLGPTAFVRDASLRVYGTFEQPNPYAGYINIPLSIALTLTLLGGNWRTRILAGITTLLLALAEFLSQSRGGEIAIAITLLFIVIVGFPRIRPVLGLLAIPTLGFIGAGLAGLVSEKVFSPMLRILGLADISFTAPTPQDYSTAERLAHWIAGLRMFFDHPLLGVGIGNFPDAYPQYFITIFVNPLGHAHNYYINIAAEAGFFGLLAYLFFLGAIFVAGRSAYLHVNRRFLDSKKRVLNSKQDIPLGIRSKLLSLLGPLDVNSISVQALEKLTNDRALAIGLLAALLSVSVHNFVDNLYVHSLTNLIALLIIALIRLERVPSSALNHTANAV